jgi:hypothetical protein
MRIKGEGDTGPSAAGSQLDYTGKKLAVPEMNTIEIANGDTSTVNIMGYIVETANYLHAVDSFFCFLIYLSQFWYQETLDKKQLF